jgi:twitching motility protein PilT
MILAEWVLRARTLGASDVHLQAGTPVVVRVRGELSAISEALPAARVAELGRELLNNEQWEQFRARGSADLSINVAGTRCRVNLFQTIRGVALAVRLLASSTNTLKSCNLHPDLSRLTEAQTGLVIVSGPTGCGKSTTLAAMVEEINASRARNIITIESPIEYLYANNRSYVRQREVPTHSPTYEQAIIDALRENPDVLVIGEMRTPEAMRLTLNAAETGHLVLATMHSSTCAEALNRLCMSFPSEIQGSVRAQVADCLVAVVCQRLEFLQEYQLRVPLCEVLIANSNARGTIRSGSFSQLATVIQSGGEDGMWSFERYRRWMEQKRDWVMPSRQLANPSVDVEAPYVAAPPVARPTPKPAAEAPIDISIDEPADLAELARRIEKKIR